MQACRCLKHGFGANGLNASNEGIMIQDDGALKTMCEKGHLAETEGPNKEGT